MLPPNGIILFDGTNASIPSGFTRETTLDSKYPKSWGNSVEPNNTGGASTHTHSSTAHTHTINAHTHSVVSGSYSGNQQSGTGSINAGKNSHTHSGSPSVNTSSIQSVAVTYSAFSNDPPYYTVIFIKSSGYNLIPYNGMIINEATTRTGLAFHSASAGRFIKGAGTSANAGSTGGTTTNTHTIDHTHTAQHSHSGTSGGASSVTLGQSQTNTGLARNDHTHPITLDNTTPTSSSNSSIGSQAETVQPAYRTLNIFKNETANNLLPKTGDIVLWLGASASLPVGWVLCNGSNGTPDMRDRFFKHNSTATTTSTGGSNTHTHASESHTHTIPSHTHTGSLGMSATPAVQATGSGTSDYWQDTHTHTASSVSSETSGLASGNTTANSSDNQPEYRIVAYIMATAQAVNINGGILFGLL